MTTGKKGKKKLKKYGTHFPRVEGKRKA